MSDRLFTPRFFIMCAYSFTVFVSVFQLLPTAPYRVLDLGGTTAAAGLFLGLLTYSSAFSAPVTGPIADRLGHRRVLIAVSLVLTICSASYAIIPSYRLMFAIVVIHGLFWSALLSASGAYMMATVPAHRRAEGLGYWGLTSGVAIAVAPALGFWVYQRGWAVLCVELTLLNLLMAIIAWRLPDDREAAVAGSAADGVRPGHDAIPAASFAARVRRLSEWRVLLLTAAMALISFGYGGLTSFAALFADALSVTPRSLFLTAMAAAVLTGRLTLGRMLDGFGYRRVLLPCLTAPPVGLLILAFAQGPVTFLMAALVFGAGFGLMHPAYTAYVMGHVPSHRRGAAFGAMFAAFDTGIGTGSWVTGWIVHHSWFRVAFGVAAVVSALALPCFLFAERKLGFRSA